ncbi:hypothetical protein AAVH_20860 [Aphelenchoides avenae]|nr:hypothetical protein AAVH_20860 [Aphelenchus avenae]
MGVNDAIKAFSDWETKIVLFGEAKKKYTRYVGVRDQLKRQPLTDAERKLVETADRRARGLGQAWFGPPLMVASVVPPSVWIWNCEVRKVQSRFLRVIARLPLPVIAAYTLSAFYVAHYAQAHTADKYFTRDGGIVHLVEKYQRNAGGDGAKSVEAPNEFIYHLDGTSEGGTSGVTGF